MFEIRSVRVSVLLSLTEIENVEGVTTTDDGVVTEPTWRLGPAMAVG